MMHVFRPGDPVKQRNHLGLDIKVATGEIRAVAGNRLAVRWDGGGGSWESIESVERLDTPDNTKSCIEQMIADVAGREMPTCPLSEKRCTSWTCHYDVCADPA